jgi:RNA polymerase sigma-70 factor (ECF subfamily)
MASSAFQQNEEALVARAQEGDVAAFEELYLLFRKRVFAICFGIVRNEAEAEDLVQESFLSLFTKLRTFRGESQFSTWFHRLVVNLALTQFRKKGRNNESLDELMEAPDGTFERQLGSVDRELQFVPDRIALERAIKLLSPKFRLIILMHDIEGFKHEEIGQIFGYSIRSSKNLLFRARKSLLELLDAKIDPRVMQAKLDALLADNGNDEEEGGEGQ